MPTQTARWRPVPAPNIVAYKLLYSDTGTEGPFLEKATILNVPTGPNYDTNTGTFFYTDAEVPYRWYRLWTLDAYGNTFGDDTTAPFPPNNNPVDAPVSTTYALNENTHTPGNFRYVSPGGTPIADATIRVYTKLSWDTRQYNQVVGVTVTTATGDWKDPIFVTPGNTFVVHYSLPNVWGPDTVEVTI